MIYRKTPEIFHPRFEVVGCFIQCDGEIILLHRQDHKPEGGTWGIPSGKIHEGESLLDTACRETSEETGLRIPHDRMKFFSTAYVKFTDYDFIYHMFHTEIDQKAEIKINEREHKNARWISPKDALNLPLIEDLDNCIKLFFNL